MANANYVCTICSQTFTRRWRGKTHNINLHSGTAKIVRLVDYIVGRLNGQYFPGDPSLYRSKKSNIFSHEGNSTIFDRERFFKTNKERDAVGKKGAVNKIAEDIGNFSQFQQVTQTRIQQNEWLNQKDSLSHIIEEYNKAIIKMAKIKKILSKYGSRENVQQMMKQIASNCMTMGDYTPLDMALDEITKWDQLKESKDYLFP